MSNIIDEKIVEMSFDNRDFEKNVHESMSTLRKLKDSFNFSNAEKSFETLQKATESVNFKSFATGSETASASFSDFLSVVGNVWAIKKAVNALDTLESKMVSMAKSMSIDQITAGWSKYEEKTQSVQTIMSATKKPIEEVNKYLEKLNWFSDETSYSFTDMTSNVGKFTSVGVDLDTATKAIMGISNWAAKSGQGVNEASRAMYNLAQALSVGSVKLMDWKSIENANMATTEFKQAAMDAGVALGKLRKQGDKYVTTTKGTEVTTKNFSQTLNEAWFSSEVLLKTLGRYGGYAEQLYDFMQENADGSMTAADAMKIYKGEVDELGMSSFKAAQEAITLTQAIDATKDAVSSGWATTFEILFGNYEEAKESWTDLANVLWDLFAGGGEQRNSFLEAAFGQTPREMLEDTLEVAQINSEAFYTAVGEVLKRHHWDLGDLEGEWESLSEFAKGSDAWKDPEIVAEALDLISKSLDLQNNSTEQIETNWKALQKEITDAGGSVSDFERQATIALKENGTDVDALIEQYGSFDKAVTEGKILSPDVISKAFTALSKQSTDYTKTIKGGATSLEEFEQLFQDVYTKNLYGTGTQRQEELTKAGWDYAKVQALITKRANNVEITEEDLKDLRSEQIVKVEGLSKKYEELGATYASASDNAEEMARSILLSGSDMNYLVENLDGFSGRELIFGSFLGVLENLSSVVETFRDVWAETFMSNPEGLLKTLAFVYDFVHSFELGEKELGELSDAFRGVLDVISGFGNIIGTIFGLLSPASSKLSDLVKKIISIGGAIGRVLSIVSNLLVIDINNFLFSLPEKLSAGFEKLGELLDGVKDKFVALFDREDGSNKLLDRIEKIKAAIDIVKSKFSEVKQAFESAFGFQVAIDPLAKAEGLSVKLHRVFELLSPIVEDVKEKLSKLFSPEIASITQVFDKVKAKFEEIKTTLEPIYNSVKDFFTISVPETITSTIDKIRERFEQFKQTVTDVIDKVKSFFGGDDTERKKASKSDELVEKLEGREDDKKGKGLKLSLGDSNQQNLTRLQKIGVAIKYFKDRVSDLISNAFPGFANWISKISNAFEQLRGIIQNSEIYQKIREIFETKISPAVANAISFLKEKFIALKEVIQNSKIFQKIKELFETKISPALSNAFTIILEKIKSLRDLIKGSTVFKTISDFFTTTANPFISKAFEKISEKVSKLSKDLKNFNPLEIIANFFTRTVPNFFSDSLSKIIKKIKELFSVTSENKKPFAFIDTLRERIAGLFRFLMENSFGIRNILIGIFAMVSGSDKIFDIITKIKELFSKEDSGFKLNGALQLALAVGILAGAITLLSRIDPQKAIKGAIGVGAIITALLVACKLLSKEEKVISGSNTPLAELAKSTTYLAGVVIILSRLKASQAIKGVLGLAALFLILTRMMNLLEKNSANISSAKDTFKELAEALRNMAIAVRILGGMDLTKMGQGIAGLGVMMAELFALLFGITKLKKDITIAAGVITAIGFSMGLLATVVWAIGSMPLDTARQGVIGIIGLCVGLAAVFFELSKLSGPVAIGAAVILAIGAAIGLMANAVKSIASIDDLQNTFIAIIGLLGTFTLVGLGFANFAPVAVAAIGGLAAFSLFTLALSGVFALLSKLTSEGSAIDNGIKFFSKLSDSLNKMFSDIAKMSGYMLASIGVFVALGAAIPLIISGITGLATIITGLALLNKIPELQEFINSGADLLILFAKILGRVVGELVGELLATVTGKLPDLAEGLSNFAKKLLPFVAVTQMMKKVDLASGMRNLLQAILVLGAADFGRRLYKTIFKTSLISAISKDIVEFGKVLHDFIRAVAGLDREAGKQVEVDVDKIKDTLDIVPKLQELSKMDFSGTGIISGIFSGNLFTFSAGIWAFGKAYLAFADALVGSGLTTEDGKAVPALDSTKITDLDSAIQTMNKLADITPPTTNSGLKKFFEGDNSLSNWGSELAEFGPKFLIFADQLTKSGLSTKVVSVSSDGESASSDVNIEPLNEGTIELLKKAIESLDSLSKISPPPAYVSIGDTFFEATSLTDWGKDLAEFGPKFLIFADMLVKSGLTVSGSKDGESHTIEKLDETKLSLLDTAIASISKMAAVRTPPQYENIGKKYFETNSLTDWGNDLAQFGPLFLSFADQLIKSGFTNKTEDGKEHFIEALNEDKITLLDKAIASIGKMAAISTPPEYIDLGQGFFSETSSLTDWGNDLATFGPLFLKFADQLIKSGLTETDAEGNKHDIAPLDSGKITLLNEAISSISSLADIEPPTKKPTAIAWLTGDNGLAAWGKELSGLGDGFNEFITSLTTSGLTTEYINSDNQKSLAIDYTKIAIINKGIDFIRQLSEIEVPEQTGWFDKIFSNDSSLSGFGSNLKKLGEGLRDFIGYLGGFAESMDGTGGVFSKFKIDNSAITLAKSAMDIVDRIVALQIPEKAGLIDKMFEGDNSLEGFASGVEALGDAVRTFIMGVNGFDSKVGSVDSIKFSEDDIKQVLDIIPIVQSLARIRIGYITTDQWGSFGWMMEQLGPSIRTFINEFVEVGEDGKKLDTEAVNTVISILPIINVLAEAGNDIQGKGYKNFKDFGSNIKELINPIKEFIEGINSTFAENKVAVNKDAIEKVLDIIPLITLLAQSSLNEESDLEYSSSSFLQQLGKDIAALVQTINNNPLDQTKTKAVTDLIDSVKNADVTPFSTFVTTFKTKWGEVTGIFAGAYDKFVGIGLDIARGLADGITKGTADYVVPAAQAMSDASMGTTKEEVDSNSPSKEFEKIGGYVSEGFALGIQNGTKDVEKSAGNLGKSAIDSTKDSVDSHSPSKEFEKIGGFIDKGLAKGITSNMGVAETASQKLGDATTGAFSADSSGLGKGILSDVVGAISEAGSAGKGESDEFASEIVDSMFGSVEEGAKEAAEESGKTAEEATKKTVKDTVKGAGEGAKEGAEEVTRDEIAGVADVTISEFETRKDDMIRSAEDLVIKMAEQIQAKKELFRRVAIELFDAFTEGIKENEGVKSFIDFFDNIMHLSDLSEDQDAMMLKLQDSVTRINDILNGINITIDTSPFDAVTGFITTVNGMFEEGENGELSSRFDDFVKALNNFISGINEAPEVDGEKLSVIKTFANDMVKAAEGIAGVDDTTFADFVKQIASSIEENSEDIRLAADKIVHEILTVFEDFFDWFYNIGVEWVRHIADGMEEGSKIAADTASTVASQILGRFREAGQAEGGQIGQDIVKSISDGLSSDEAKQTIDEAVDSLLNPDEESDTSVDSGTPTLQPTDETSGMGEEDTSTPGKKYATNFVNDLASGITDGVETINGAIQSLTENADLTTFTDTMKENLENSYAQLSAPIETLSGALSSILPDGSSLANNMIDGMINALYARLQEAVDAVTAFASALAGAMMAALEINSPSKVFYRIGEGIIEGTMYAVYDGIGPSEEGMYTYADRIVRGFVKGFRRASKQSNPSLKKAAGSMMETVGSSKVQAAAENFEKTAKDVNRTFQQYDLGTHTINFDETQHTFETAEDMMKDWSQQQWERVLNGGEPYHREVTVTPVFDLTNVDKAADEINRSFEKQVHISADINTEMNNARKNSGGDPANGQNKSNGTTINFVQNNTSPQALTPSKVYKNTKTLLQQIRSDNMAERLKRLYD